MTTKRNLTAIILTYNEQIHIERVIRSALTVADKVLIIDSYSTDETLSIAESLGAEVRQHSFVNQAQQMQWAMDEGFIDSTWMLRLDADEYLTPELTSEINSRLLTLPVEVSGIVLKRQVHFLGRWIKHGGYYPIKLLRLWKTGHAAIEQKHMDEHTFLIQGKEILFDHDFVDDNLNSLSWWTSKHNDYATREAIDILMKQSDPVLAATGVNSKVSSGQAGMKRWYKNNLYLTLPLFIRAFLYFQYRFWIRMGFLDGKPGLIWHFLQGFWYRFLVDAKIAQIHWWAKTENKSVAEILAEKFKVDLKTQKQE